MIATTLLALIFPIGIYAESGYEAWLRYPLAEQSVRAQYAELPESIVTLGFQSQILLSARDELTRGIKGILGHILRHQTDLPKEGESVYLLGTINALYNESSLHPTLGQLPSLEDDAFLILKTTKGWIIVTANNDRGILYGTFALLRNISLHQTLQFPHQQNPSGRIRWTNEWNNLDGAIERGYAGRSIYFDGGNVVSDLTRAKNYARLLASVGINGIVINNVNADTRIFTPEFLPQLERLAAAFRPWGVQVAISVDFASPKILGKLDTFDPLNETVAKWWKNKTDEVYATVKDLGGFVIKADSEGRAGPSAYNRTHADAANVVARALKPHGGVMFYRGFVYDAIANRSIPINDRARAAYDNFIKLDGLFDDNAIIQLKNGPIDFQVREPVSPLFGALNRTNFVLEVQVTQEYLGQQRHVCFLAPMWKQVLDFDLHAKPNGDRTLVSEVASGKTFGRPFGGFVAVVNVGKDKNWLGHDLAMANLYAFGRLSWNPDMTSEQIIDEWTQMTFNGNKKVIDVINYIQLQSWLTYEKYTGNLGIGTLTDSPEIHYGPAVESSKRNGVTGHRSDQYGSGVDRTVATGSGFIGQYRPEVAKVYESLSTCPDELLLFMHHVNYTHVLKSGKTVIQHFYDEHYSGADDVVEFVKRWDQIKGLIDDERHESIRARLVYQAGHAVVWRDAICQWFKNISGIEDTQGRVGNNKNRIEAESMKLNGYMKIDIIPFETASKWEAVSCSTSKCTASYVYDGAAGWFDIVVQYYDQTNGVSSFNLLVAGEQVGHWLADAYLMSTKPDGHTSTRYTAIGVSLRKGDTIEIVGTPGGSEKAVIDYIEIHPTE